MGDTATNICDHETSIMLALSAFVLERSVLILDIAHSLCQLDCLLSLATVARENNWCRPDVVDQGRNNNFIIFRLRQLGSPVLTSFLLSYSNCDF
jgi:DNA mismatch repair ATPase MutS